MARLILRVSASRFDERQTTMKLAAVLATLVLLAATLPAMAQDRMPPIPADKQTPEQKKAAAAFKENRKQDVFGPFVPRDPDRAAIGPYQPLDWYLDPVQQLRFPSGVPYKEWKLYEMRRKGRSSRS